MPPPVTRPVRLQLSRKARFNLRAVSRALNGLDAVSVARPTRWGNPFHVGQRVQSDPSRPVAVCFSQAQAVEAYRDFCEHFIGRRFVADARRELAGKNLACWCKPGDPCHADVLLELANRDV